MQDPNQPPNYGRPENPGGQLPNDPTQGYNVPPQPGNPPPSYPQPPDYSQAGYQQPPSQGPQPPPQYNQPPTEGYPQQPAYGQPPTQGYPPPQPPYVQPPTQGYQQPPYQQPAYGQPPPSYPQPPQYGQPPYQQPYQSGGPFTPPPMQSTTVVKSGGGAGPIIIIAVVIVVLLIAASLGSYFLFFNKPSGSPSGGSTAGGSISGGGSTLATPATGGGGGISGGGLTLATPTAVTSGGGSTGGGGGSSDNANLLKQAANNMKSLKSFHLDLSGSAAGQTISMNGDIDVAGNKSSLTIAAGGVNISAITIVSDTYLSTDGGKTFTKTDSSSNPVSGLSSFTKMWDSFKPADVDKAASALKDANPANDTIDGANTKHITANAQDLSSLSSAGSSGAMIGKIDVWISTDANPTIRQMRVNGTSGGQSLDFTIKWSKINENFNITAPPSQ